MLGILQQTVDILGRAERLDKVAAPLQAYISAAFARGGTLGRRLQNGLNGVWLGHPLHPVLTDGPIGFWTAAVSLDILSAFAGSKDVNTAADVTVGLGVGAAVGAAITGFADWQFTGGESRRIGVAHATLNTGATALNVLSLLLRSKHHRQAGRCLTLAGYALMSAAAYLGGHLIYEDRIGVDHTADQTPPPDFVPVLSDGELNEGQPRRVDASGMPVMLVRREGRIYALADTCAHLGGPLSEGTLRDGAIICPWHSSRFALADGRTLDGPSAFPQPILETRVRDGQIEIRAVASLSVVR